MYIADITCPDWKECGESTQVDIEYESAGDESEHEAICSGCGKKISFRIQYSPVIVDETIIED